jgi:undecaprenyl-diphosphatase
MNLIESTILGVLQGILEWLPVSSEGQTMLVMLNFMQIDPAEAITVAIFLHIGTMFAVLIKFRHEFVAMLNIDSKLLKVIIIATLSTAITAIPLLIFIKDLLATGEVANIVIGIMLILTGIMLGIQKRMGTTRDMVFAGLAQGFSIIPGISRSGTTITVLLMCGIKQELALKLSFIMSVPAVLGAIILFDVRSVTSVSIGDAVIMILSALILGYLTMSILLRFAKRVNFACFCISLGVLTLLMVLLPVL